MRFGRNNSESPNFKSHSCCSRDARLSQSQCYWRILKNRLDSGFQLEGQSRCRFQKPFLQSRKLGMLYSLMQFFDCLQYSHFVCSYSMKVEAFIALGVFKGAAFGTTRIVHQTPAPWSRKLALQSGNQLVKVPLAILSAFSNWRSFL